MLQTLRQGLTTRVCRPRMTRVLAIVLLGAIACGNDTQRTQGGPGSGGADASGGTQPVNALGGSSFAGVSTAEGGVISIGGTGTQPETGGTASFAGMSAVGGSADAGRDGHPEGGSVSDAGECTEFVMPADCTIPSGAVLPAELRCTGLYADWTTRTLRCGVQRYEPAHQLWSDGAGKQRYVWLPAGATIDVKSPDDFVFPIGTRFWKEFYVGPSDNQRLGETRYLVKVKGGWLYTTYVWSADETTATQTNTGVDDLFGSGHGVPTRDQCKTCHSGRRDYVLGWDFVMLGAGASGVTARDLAQRGLFANLEPAWLEIAVPGDEVERLALGYLHANCGVSCHNETTNATAKPSGLFLRLEVAEMDRVLSTDAARSGINRVPSPNADYGDLAASDAGDYYDFRPLDTVRSLSVARMAYRGSVAAMPPIASHQVHGEGVAVVKAWVESMTEARGYPAPAP
jgi:hypothetical protein